MKKNFEIRSLSELVRYIEDLCSDKVDQIFFRGQQSDDPLLPSVARLKPKRSELLLEAEKTLFRAFKRRSLPFLEMRPETDWDWLAVAQHYGLPTRLLDWSVNALTAVWFAVERPADSGKRRSNSLRSAEPLLPSGVRPDTLDEGLGVVWLFHAQKSDYIDYTLSPSNLFDIKRPSILVPRYVSKRIVAQGGYFTVHPSWEKEPYFRPMEEDENFRDRLVKISIPRDIFPSIRHDLTRLGVNAMSIYQDLVGLCQDIKWRYAYAKDEGAEMWGENGQLIRSRPETWPWLPGD